MGDHRPLAFDEWLLETFLLAQHPMKYTIDWTIKQGRKRKNISNIIKSVGYTSKLIRSVKLQIPIQIEKIRQANNDKSLPVPCHCFIWNFRNLPMQQKEWHWKLQPLSIPPSCIAQLQPWKQKVQESIVNQIEKWASGQTSCIQGTYLQESQS